MLKPRSSARSRVKVSDQGSPKSKVKKKVRGSSSTDEKRSHRKSQSRKSKKSSSSSDDVGSEPDAVDRYPGVRQKAGVSCPGSPGGGATVSATSVGPVVDGKKDTANLTAGCTVKDLKDAWRREFKIKGQIGKIGEKDSKLDYLSVKRQVDAGVKKGYEGSDII